MIRVFRAGWRALRAGEWSVQLVIVTLLAVSYHGTVRVDTREYIAWALQVLSWTALLLAGSYLFNSYCDRAEDRFKQRRASLQPGVSLGVAALCLATGVALAVFSGAGVAVIALVVATVLVAVAYSQRPVRLKERGWWGVLAAALFQRIPPFWMIVIGFPIAVGPAVSITGWLAVVGLLFIIEHQIEDIDSDRAAGVQTLATSLGRSSARRLLAWLHATFLAVSVATVVVLARASVDTNSALLGAGIVAGGSVLLAVLARVRYPRADSERSGEPFTHAPAVEDEHPGIPV